MEKITINTSCCRSEILVGEKWETAFSMLPENGVVIVTDDNVKQLYGKRFPKVPVFSVKPGEESKKLDVVGSLADTLLEAGIDRSGFILAAGGGVVSDIAGFLASIYMRGIRCGYISSTLLSQVDASTGGKTGVNLGDTKNILGIIRQPEFVICDPEMLQTLPEQEYLSGLAELIKTAVIGDKELFELIERSADQIMSRDSALLTELIARSVRFKGAIVSKDEMENGLRRILNFGHTFGHAVEIQKKIKHGFAVASGMVLASEYSFEKGLISIEDKTRIIRMLEKYKLVEKMDIPYSQVENHILRDKKKTGSEIHFVFTTGIGNASVEKVPVTEVLDFYKRFRAKN